MTTRTKPKPAVVAGADDSPVLEDVGCQYAPRCVTCPWSVCIKELPYKERGEFLVALRTVRRYLALPDGAIAPCDKTAGTPAFSWLTFATSSRYA